MLFRSISIGPNGNPIPSFDEVTTVGNTTNNSIAVSSITLKSITFSDSSIQTTAWAGYTSSIVSNGHSVYVDTTGQLILPLINLTSTSAGWITSTNWLNINAGGEVWSFTTDGSFITPYGLVINQQGLFFPDHTEQLTAYPGTSTLTTFGGVRVDGTSLLINNGVISVNPLAEDYIEVYDSSSSITLSTTPTLLKPGYLKSSVNITYSSTTGVFTFPDTSILSLALTVNVTSTGGPDTVYIYAETNNGVSWAATTSSGKIVSITNNTTQQVVYSAIVQRNAGQSARYWIYTANGKIGRAHV